MAKNPDGGVLVGILDDPGHPEQARFESKADSFITVSNGEEEAWPAEQIAIIDGTQVKVYPLGAVWWIWEEA